MRNYYSEFRNFDKFAKQTDSITESIRKINWSLHKDEVFYFVDIGSNDGFLTEKICRVLFEKYGKSKTYASEPEEESYKQLIDRLEKYKNIQIDRMNFDKWIKKYKKELDSKVHLLLHSHSFYHFQKKEWKSIINQGNEILSSSGKQIIIIDSEKTSINKIKYKIDKSVSPQKTVRKYGEFLTGNEINNFLKTEELSFQHKIIEQHVIIPDNKNSLQNFARIIGFVFRHSPDIILKSAKDDLIKFMSEYKTNKEYIFPRFQDMFILQKS